MKPTPIKYLDGYKTDHRHQYPDGTEMVYSNLTCRASRSGQTHAVAFGFQYFVQEYLINQFNEGFFECDLDDILKDYQRRMDNYLGPGAIKVDHIAALHDLGYLPLLIKALPEGTRVPLRVPMLTIRNTHPEFFWLTNMLETLLSNVLWGPITSATTAYAYRKTFDSYAYWTGGDMDFCSLQGHDFSFRGLTGIENAMTSGAAHLLSFTGTDTIPAIDFLERYYGANSDDEIIGLSVPATEHSVMCMGEKDAELSTFKRLITDVYPNGIVSIVSDTWDLWKVLTVVMPMLHDEVMARDGKVVIRPDSGDPTLIICGDSESPHGYAARTGVLELLWQEFGGTTNDKGYRVLDPHVGVIYGEAISPTRQEEILSRMKEMGFCSSNIVFGIGSYTYQYVTRDELGMAVKSTYGEVNGQGIAIQKDPITDSGLKKSASGLLRVDFNKTTHRLEVTENCTWAEEQAGELRAIFKDGQPGVSTTLKEIRGRLGIL